MSAAMENQAKHAGSQTDDVIVVKSKGSSIYRILDSVKKAIVIMGTCFLLFIAARNSLHWQIHRIWGATGSFWQLCWDHIYVEWFKKNDLMLLGLGSFIVTTGVFWLANLFFLILDTTGCPSFAKKYKVQEELQVEMPKLNKAVKMVLFNQVTVGLPFALFNGYAMLWRGCPVGGELPTFHWVMFEIMIFSFVLEIFFYYAHRLLHQPRLYDNIHKLHHEWTAPIGIAALYAHPLECFWSVILPTALGPLFIGSHLATAWLWFSLALMSTTVAHCGYHLPLLPSPEAHDYHHLKLNQNFGVLGVLDRLHGTDILFRASKQYERHSMLLSSIPLNQRFPTSPNKKQE